MIRATWTDYASNIPDRVLIKEASLEEADFKFEDLNMLAKLLSS